MKAHTAALALLSLLASVALSTGLASTAILAVPSGLSEANGVSWFGTPVHWSLARDLLPFTLLASTGTVALVLFRGRRDSLSEQGMLANSGLAALAFAAVAAGGALVAPMDALANLGAVAISVLLALLVGVLTGIAVHPLLRRMWLPR